MTQRDFDDYLAMVIDKDNPRPSTLLLLPGVYELLRVAYREAVERAWARDQARQQEGAVC